MRVEGEPELMASAPPNNEGLDSLYPEEPDRHGEAQAAGLEALFGTVHHGPPAQDTAPGRMTLACGAASTTPVLRMTSRPTQGPPTLATRTPGSCSTTGSLSGLRILARAVPALRTPGRRIPGRRTLGARMPGRRTRDRSGLASRNLVPGAVVLSPGPRGMSTGTPGRPPGRVSPVRAGSPSPGAAAEAAPAGAAVSGATTGVHTRCRSSPRLSATAGWRWGGWPSWSRWPPGSVTSSGGCSRTC